jgi:hypothetical protein
MTGRDGHRSFTEERVRGARDAKRWLLGAALTGCAAIGALAPVAGAATVAHDPRVAAGAAYTAGADELNRVRVAGAGTLIQFSDPAGIAAPDAAAPGGVNDCITAPSGVAAACPGANPVTVSLGDRVDSVRLAVEKARSGLNGAVLASDAFFPFADGPQLAIEAGVTAIVQPGGSVRDSEVVAAAEAAGVALVVTGRRHFRH